MEKIRETLSKAFTAVKDRWVGIAARTRIIVLSVAVVVVVSAIVLTVILNNPGMALLCRTSGNEEATTIVGALAAEKIDAKVNGNNDVLVKENFLLDARRVISEQGLPRPGFNYDTWDLGIGMFTTDSQMNEKRKHLYQDFVMAQMNSIPEVESSMVVLTIPNDSNYVMVENKQVSTASVMLTLKTGTTLTNEQIKGIHSLILNAVPGLTSENITVTDGSGILLIPDSGDLPEGENLALKQQRLQMETEFKTLLAENAKGQMDQMLNTAFKEGHHSLAVNVKMDFSSDREVEETTYFPVVGLDSGIISDFERQYAAGGIAAEGGPVGTVVNGPIDPIDYPTIPDIAAENEFYMDWVEKTNYKVSEKIEKYKEDGLRVTEVSASLLIDSEPLPPATLELWEKIVAKATGAEIENVAVMAMPFQLEPTIPDGEKALERGTAMRNVLIWIIVILGALLIVLLIMALNTSSSKKKRQIRYRGIPAVEGMGGYLRDDSFQPNIPDQDDFDLPSLFDDNETKDVVLKREIKEFSKSNPEIVAQLIRTWLRDEDI